MDNVDNFTKNFDKSAEKTIKKSRKGKTLKVFLNLPINLEIFHNDLTTSNYIQLNHVYNNKKNKFSSFATKHKKKHYFFRV